MANKGDLRVWWIPQVPGECFYTPVTSIKEAALLLDMLARYDMFQLKNDIKSDYSNAGGLTVFDNGEWIDWEDDSGEDIDYWMDQNWYTDERLKVLNEQMR